MTDPSDRIRDVASLALEMERGWDPKYLLFWGHTPAKGKTVGPFVLSQWYPRPFRSTGCDSRPGTLHDGREGTPLRR